MNLVLVEPDGALRGQLLAALRRTGIAVAPFMDPSTAFLFLLGRLDEIDGVVVNDDGGEWSSWLRRRLEILSAPIPVAVYAGRHPELDVRVLCDGNSLGSRSGFPTALGGSQEVSS